MAHQPHDGSAAPELTQSMEADGELRQNRGRDLALAFAAGALALCGSLANFLGYNRYPFLRAEVGLIAGAFLIAALLMSFFYVAQRQWGRSFLEGLLALLFVDLNSNSIALAGAVGLAVCAISMWRRFSFLPVIALFGAVVLITKALGIGAPPSWITVQQNSRVGPPLASREPAIVHIILDEHIGLEGLLSEGPEERKLSKELRSFYLANGFAVYGGAYSQYYNTINAVPSILNYGTRLAKNGGSKGADIGATEHLQSLVDRGHPLTVFESDYALYCAEVAFRKCFTYDSSGLRPTLAVPMPATDRAALIALKFLSLSQAGMGAAATWDIVAPPLRRAGLPVPLYRLDSKASVSVAALQSLRVLAAQLKEVRPGDAIFAHLLLPHFPYVVREDCTYLPYSQWVSLTGGASVEVRRQADAKQLRCTKRKVAMLLDSLARSPAGLNAVVIIHGDHGSRITELNPNDDNFGRISDADMIAGYSTLFAIRAPGIVAGYYPERVPVPALLRDFSQSGFRMTPHPAAPDGYPVFLADQGWKPVRRVSLPSSWTGAVGRPLAGQPEGRVSH